MKPRALVAVVDDDESVRESLPDLLGVLGYAAKAFASAEEFLTSDGVCDTQCLILDVKMPGMSGPELQRELLREGTRFRSSSLRVGRMGASVATWSIGEPSSACSSRSASRTSDPRWKPPSPGA